MNRTELVEMISEKSEVTKAVAEKTLTAVLDSVTDALKEGEPVVLVNFGTFLVKDRAERMGRNPQTGEPIKISASKSVSFKAGKALKDAVKS